MEKFVIKKREDGQFMFNLHAKNGEIILTSEGYTSKQECKEGIQSVKVNSIVNSRFKKNQGIPENKTNEYYWFNLIARNGEIIGSSELYDSEQGMENGISSVQRCAPIANIKDRTLWYYNIF